MKELFQPCKFKSLALRNRIVMAPMTRFFSPGGVPTQAMAAYYRRRAERQVGLILTEGTLVNRPLAHNHPDVPRFHGDALPAWGDIVDEVHRVGGAIAPQLWHVGATLDSRFAREPRGLIDSPSGITLSGEAIGQPCSDASLWDTVAAFAQAAKESCRLGFDAVELHGAHGYLLDQFFFMKTNQRKDSWGGSTLAMRTRFASEVIREVRAAIGPEKLLILRVSQWKPDSYDEKLAHSPAELQQWLEPLADAGVDMFDCSQRRFWEPEFAGSDLNFAGWAKKLSGKPTITVGSVGLSADFISARSGAVAKPETLDELSRRLARGDFDLVAIGRSLLADPDWVLKVRDGNENALMSWSEQSRNTLS
jgi:2,4-dienoyl-CoA reductase-like NADH-dependent reductase (Old Yellow Enzyme family)